MHLPNVDPLLETHISRRINTEKQMRLCDIYGNAEISVLNFVIDQDHISSNLVQFRCLQTCAISLIKQLHLQDCADIYIDTCCASPLSVYLAK